MCYTQDTHVYIYPHFILYPGGRFYTVKWIDEQLNILLVNTSEKDYTLIQHLLADIKDIQFNLAWANGYQAGLELISQKRHDAYLIDYRLGKKNGLQLLQTAVDMGCQAPLILLTRQGEREIDLAAMQAGAADFLAKDQIGPMLLERSIRYAIERKRVEEDLRQSQEQFKVVLQDSPIVVFNQDKELRYTWVYNAPPQLQGELIIGKTDAEVFLSEEAGRLIQIKTPVLETGQGTREEVQVTIGHTLFYYDLAVEPLYNAAHEIIGLTCAAMDITNRKQAEEALRQARDELEQRVVERTAELAIANSRLTEEVVERERLEQQIKGSLQRRTRQVQTSTEIAQEIATTPEPDELFQQVVNLVQEQFNYYHAHLYTLEGSDLVMKEGTGEAGRRMKELNHRIPLDAERSLVAQAAREHHPILIPDVYQEPNWLPNPLLPETKSELAVPIKLGDDVLGVLDVQNDTTDGLNLEDQILLMGLCGQIAVAINNRRLEANRKRAEEAQKKLIEELDAFAHTVGYNLRDPLDLIVGYTNLLKEQARLPEKLQEYLNAIARNSHKMSNIINELEMLTGVRKAEVEVKPLNMARIVAEVQQRLAYLIQEYQANIIVSEYWPTALGHKPWVEEVWANYLSNAIKYGGHPPQVRIGATAQSDGMIRFWVRDNGPGFTSDEQVQLFSNFSTPPAKHMTGFSLSLSIVRRIVTKLGGQVWVESEGAQGQGSVFSFTLPGTQKMEWM